MAYSGVLGGIYNVLINLKDIDDKNFCDEMRKKCKTLKLESQDKLNGILKYIESQIS